ncbi:hypothetical protein TNCV_2031961, partial [Trichonephila clavipes]
VRRPPILETIHSDASRCEKGRFTGSTKFLVYEWTNLGVWNEPEKEEWNCPLFSVLKIFAKTFTIKTVNLRWNKTPNPDSLNKKLAIQKHSKRYDCWPFLTKTFSHSKALLKVLAFYIMRSREIISIGWSFQRCLETPSRLDWPRKIIQPK